MSFVTHALTGEVVNLTGWSLTIVNDSGTKICEFKKGGLAEVDYQDVYLGCLNGKIELGFMRPIGIRGLPQNREGKYYIVSGKVVRAAALMGRTLEDLLVPDMPLMKYIGNARETRGYRRLIPATYFCQGT